MVARVKTWTTNETLASSDLNTEFNNIINAISTGTADHIDLTDVYAWTGAHSWSGATTHTNTLTVGVDDTGHDVKFYGATSGQYMLWDESADELVLAGETKLSFHDAAGGENIIATSNGHLEVNAGTTLDITAPTVDLNSSTEFNIDTAAYDLNASGAVTIDGAGVSIDSSSASNLTTSSGALTITSAAAATWSTAAGALTLGSGAAINITPAAGSAIVLYGTINVDAGVVTGATSITSTAFVGDITGDVTGNADTFTATANNSANETVYPVFVDGATGAQGAETDTGLTYNPSTGLLSTATLTTTGVVTAASLDISGDADIDGTLEADAITLGGTALGSLYSPIAGSSSIVTTGALNSGSITSGFGNINTGSSTITTTGAVSTGALTSTGNISFDGGSFVFNESGADKDFRIEGDTNANLFVADASEDKIGFGTATPGPGLVTLGGGVAATTVRIDIDGGSDNGKGAQLAFRSGSTDKFYVGDAASLQGGSESSRDMTLYTTSGTGIRFYTGGNNRRMDISSDGNVGIGTDAPATKLDVYIGASNDDNLTLSSTSGYNPKLVFHDVSTDKSAGIEFDSGAQALKFFNNPLTTERMRIDSNGYIQQFNDAGTPYGTKMEFTGAAPDNRTSFYIKLDDTAATRGYWWSDGDITTSDGGSVNSDERLKTNIVDATDKLADVMKLKVRNFEWTPEYHPAKVGEKKIGFIAQELETVFPSLISEMDIAPDNSIKEVLYTADDDIPDGKEIGDIKVAAKAHEPTMRKTIKDAFAPILVKALQEVTVRLEAAEAEIAILKG